MMRFLVTLIASVLISAPAFAQSRQTANTLKLDDPAVRPPATVEDFAWLVGHWRAESPNMVSEETWAPASGGTMTGTFKIIRNGKSSLYEFFVLEPEGESVGIKLKHFNADMTGWEEKDAYMHFPLVKLEDGAAYFDGLTYRRIGDDAYEAIVAVSNDGEMGELSFRWMRVNGTDAAANAGSRE